MTSLHPISPKGYDILRGVMGSPEAPSRRIGKYQTVRELGRGGMAVVYEAEDPELRRRVALKILREDATDARVIQRLHREAAIGAQLRHPNIVRIFEVGVATDASGAPVHFIAMDYVEGRTLADIMAEKRTPRAKLLEIVEAVADAVGYAHEQGVVHRDLKPANVLVDGEGRAALADFGLARATSFATPLTRANAVMGTPQYMAPEQVEGRADEVDARTDVYALGVLLYEIVTGHPPFESETLASLYEKILRSDPVLPSSHDRTIDRDLEWICLTAMSRERERRYKDGRAFHRDLHRYREGQPVEARPPSLLYRLRKRLRRHRAASLVLVGAVIACAAVAFPLWRAASRANAAAIVELRDNTNNLLRSMLLLRQAGQPGNMGEFADRARAACEKASVLMPGLAEPWYRLGRVERAMMNDAVALKHQDRALGLDPDYAPALYERIVLQSRLHRAAVHAALARYFREETARSPVPVADIAAKDGEAARLRGLVEADLTRLAAAKASPDLADGAKHCARGMLAALRRDEAAAREFLRKAAAGAEPLEEAYEVLSDLEQERGDFAAAIKWRSEGIEKDKGYIPHWDERGEARVNGAMLGRVTGSEPPGALKQAIDDFKEALRLEPGRVRSLRGRATARVRLAETSADEGASLIDGAMLDLAEALAKEPGDAETRMERAYAAYRRAQIARDTGGDPATFLDQAMVDADQAVLLAPGRDEPWLRRGIIEDFRGRWSPGARTPLEWFRDAEADLQKALQINRIRLDTLKSMAMTQRDRGLHAWKGGEDPLRHFEEAMTFATRAVERGPERYDLWHLRGEIAYLRGATLQAAKQDPLGDYRKAEEDFSKSLSINDAPTEAWTSRGLLRRQRGDFLEEAGKDPTSSYREAVLDYDQASRRAPARAIIRCEGGYTRLLLGSARLQGGDAEGRKDLDECIAQLTPAMGSAESFKYRGRAHLVRGEFARKRGESPERDFDAAASDLRQAIRLNASFRDELSRQLSDVEAWLKAFRRDY